METIMRQVCFSVFVLLAGALLDYGVLPRGVGILRESRKLSLPILLYAAAEFCSYGRAAAALLPVRMLSLLYGTCLYIGLRALAGLPKNRKLRRVCCAAVFPISVLETALLGYVLLRDGRCTGAAATAFGAFGMAAASMRMLFSFRSDGRTDAMPIEHRRRV